MTDERIYLIDRSGGDLDDKCGMAYWWNRIEGERGIVPAEEPAYFFEGRVIHEDFANIAAGNALSISRLGIDNAIAARHQGWVTAFSKYINPRIEEEYETIAVEKEFILDRTPLWVAVTPDRLLRRRVDEKLIYHEYKTAGSLSNQYMGSWKFAIQLHLVLLALEEELKEKVEYAQIIALPKGQERDGRLRHPYTYAYYHPLKDKWSTKTERAEGWELRGVWEYPGGVEAWVELCGPEVAFEQFVMSAPVFLNREMVERWVRRKLKRAREIQRVSQLCRTDLEARCLHFEQRLSQCRPAFGAREPCPYLPLCWSTGADTTQQGFVPREPHHEIEIQMGENE